MSGIRRSRNGRSEWLEPAALPRRRAQRRTSIMEAALLSAACAAERLRSLLSARTKLWPFRAALEAADVRFQRQADSRASCAGRRARDRAFDFRDFWQLARHRTPLRSDADRECTRTRGLIAGRVERTRPRRPKTHGRDPHARRVEVFDSWQNRRTATSLGDDVGWGLIRSARGTQHLAHRGGYLAHRGGCWVVAIAVCGGFANHLTN